VSAGNVIASRPEFSREPRISRSHCIGSPVFDAFFVIGSPLLALASVLGAAQLIAPARVEEYVLSFLAVGYHVPTFLRAYGDPDERARSRTRLTIVPVALVLLLVALNAVDSRRIALTFVWDQYYFVRQHYGFMRIYDAKARAIDARDARLDLCLCFSWFAWIVAESDLYSYIYASHLFDAGLTPPAWLGSGIRNLSLAIALALTLRYALRLGEHWKSGRPIAWLKLALTATTYGVWYFAYVELSDFTLSYAISSAFHCLQYDAFAWHYNRAKAGALGEREGSRLFRAVHAPGRLWIFVLCIASYGVLSWALLAAAPTAVLLVNRCTGLLHYYFDAFIWRVRQPDFRQHL
jgi:hypothetical protein